MRDLKISRERFEILRREIADGSEPGLRFYILVVVSTFIRRFVLPITAFVIIAAFLSQSLVSIARERRRIRAIKSTLTESLSHIPATTLEKVYHYLENDRVQVMAKIHTPNLLKPTQVSALQEELSQKIGMPAELIMQ